MLNQVIYLAFLIICEDFVRACSYFITKFKCTLLCTLGYVSPSHERMQVGLEELQDLKGVWQELAKIWEQIDELKEKPWLSVAPRKVDKKLLHILNHLVQFSKNVTELPLFT